MYEYISAIVHTVHSVLWHTVPTWSILAEEIFMYSNGVVYQLVYQVVIDHSQIIALMGIQWKPEMSSSTVISPISYRNWPALRASHRHSGVVKLIVYIITAEAMMISTALLLKLMPRMNICWRMWTLTVENLLSSLLWGRIHTTHDGVTWSYTWNCRLESLNLWVCFVCSSLPCPTFLPVIVLTEGFRFL